MQLADPAPTRPLAVTIGAAVVTLVVVAGIVVGPVATNCAQNPGGFAVCVHERLVGIGLLPKTPVGDTKVGTAATPAEPATSASAAVAEAPPAPQPAAPPVATPTPAATPAPAAEPAKPAAETSAAPAADDASFGLVRAEPDGSLVIGGSAKPGETVEVYADDKLLGEAKTESSGDWALVPDAPIATGGVELTLSEG